MLRLSAKFYVFFSKKAIFGKPNATLFISFMLLSDTWSRFFRNMAKFFRHFSKNRVFFWKYLEKALTSRQDFSKEKEAFSEENFFAKEEEAFSKEEQEVEQEFGDILYREHPTSAKHPRAGWQARAAQFAPFAALTGFEEMTREAGRQKQKKPVLEEDRKEEFEKLFNQYYGKNFKLYSSKDFIQEYLGPFEKHPYVDKALGDYVAVAIGDQAMFFGKVDMKGQHAGLTVDEMMVPLIIFRKE